MKKVAVLVILCFYSILGFGQISVNTSLPMHPLHVDGKGNNPKDKAPSAIEAQDDFVVTKEGNVGIGVLNPTVRLDINGGSLKVVSTGNDAGKVLTSNGDGIAEIKSLPSVLPAVIGKFNPGGVNSTTTNPEGSIFTNATITLKKGKWIVNWGLTLSVRTNPIWLTSYLSTATTTRAENGFIFLNGGASKPSIGGNLWPGYAFLWGSSLIEVTNAEVTINILVKNTHDWSFTPSSWENYLYAIPFK
ncbi:hypothetical protein SAMN04488018_11259 [Myroides marinus]|uniref:Uncharacterized protein n=1 Tax=Myroides marinus TaxID=703342 RepID=A0A1H6W6X3_9FLAO|nr:hypothetical protein [Myroides marinus]SEJ10984.1 hypothetical protein SAMN04488018_11259 [Myroides marinus]